MINIFEVSFTEEGTGSEKDIFKGGFNFVTSGQRRSHKTQFQKTGERFGSDGVAIRE